MKERPILFSAPMVRAILAGRKSQTRRVINLPKVLAAGDLSRAWPDKLFGVTPGLQVPMPDESVQRLRNPWGWPEPSQLWVREAWRAIFEVNHMPPRELSPAHRVWYEADSPHQLGFGRLRPGMFMPRWASRITLEMTDVRVERLQDISYEDALAEGMPDWSGTCSNDAPNASGETPEETARRLRWPQRWHETLWNEINGDGAWDQNPFVWVIEFRRVEHHA